MCVYPASGPALAHPAWPCLLSLLMGVTNGYFGSVPMIQAAGKVPPEQRELAGELTFPTLPQFQGLEFRSEGENSQCKMYKVQIIVYKTKEESKSICTSLPTACDCG